MVVVHINILTYTDFPLFPIPKHALFSAIPCLWHTARLLTPDRTLPVLPFSRSALRQSPVFYTTSSPSFFDNHLSSTTDLSPPPPFRAPTVTAGPDTHTGAELSLRTEDYFIPAPYANSTMAPDPSQRTIPTHQPSGQSLERTEAATRQSASTSPVVTTAHTTSRSTRQGSTTSVLHAPSPLHKTGADKTTPFKTGNNQHTQSIVLARLLAAPTLDIPHCASRLNHQLRYLENMSVPELRVHTAAVRKLFMDLLHIQSQMPSTTRFHLLMENERTAPSADAVDIEWFSLFSTTVSN